MQGLEGALVEVDPQEPASSPVAQVTRARSGTRPITSSRPGSKVTRAVTSDPSSASTS
ncbi:MAG: hypothetical protein M3P97_12570 [Actinomycetota bacterium]|nr:hypothetical protein [Actinomycetota bacterium]